VDVEDLFFMLRQMPTIIEPPNAKDFIYKGGNITF
jgi:hypothetical protein